MRRGLTGEDPGEAERVAGDLAGAEVVLIGDDLASQFGTSVVHHALLRLLEERGLTLTSSYQVNLGGSAAPAIPPRPRRCSSPLPGLPSS